MIQETLENQPEGCCKGVVTRWHRVTSSEMEDYLEHTLVDPCEAC